MVALTFSAEPPGTIRFSVGPSKTAVRWADQRAMPFAEFAALLTEGAPVGIKDGTCYVPAVFRIPQRRMDFAEEIGMAVLDADCGHEEAEIVAAVEARGWEAAIHSTFSHLTDQTEVACSAIDKWREEHGDDVPGFMLAKKGYLPRVVENAEIIDERARNYVIRHNPCPKFRVVLPLSAPWLASSHPTQQMANATWRTRILALASALGLHSDQSCVDTSRLFYFPRRRSADQPFVGIHVQGAPCDIWTLPEAGATDDGGTLFTAPQRARTQSVETASAAVARAIAPPKHYVDREGVIHDLKGWAISHAGRFEIVAALKARRAGVFGARRSGVKHHAECPFDDEHTTAGDRTGCYLVNASEIGRAGLTGRGDGFFVGCKHNACSSRDRLDFVTRMLELGWLDLEDLTNPDFLVHEAHDLSPVDTSRLLANLRWRAAAGERERLPNIPDELTQKLPGSLGEMVAYIVATSHKPQPVMALGCALTAMAAVLGRRVKLAGWNTRPNVYIAAIGNSGCGKERPISAVKEMMKRAGVLHLIGAEKIKSEAGLMAQVHAQPNHVMLFDEMGYLISALTDRNAGPHLKEAIPFLMTLWSSSHTLFKSGSYADVKRNVQVDQPCCSFFGITTPDSLYSALRIQDIKSGLLSRFLVFDVGDRDLRPVAPKETPVPIGVVEWLKAWDAQPVNHTGNAIAMEGGMPLVDPLPIGMTDGAAAIFDAFQNEMFDRKRAMIKEELDALFVRPGENAMKLALIRACSCMPGDQSLIVTEADADWAVAITRAATEHMARIASEHVFDTTFQRNLAAFRSVIKRSGARGATSRELRRHKKCQLPPKDADAVLSHLVSAGEVAFVNANAGMIKANGVAVRHRNAYVWTADLPPGEDDEDG